MSDGKTALLLQCHLAQIHAQRRVVEVDGVNTHRNVAEVYVVIVQTINMRLEVLVVLHGTMHPVNAAHRIGLGTQVDECFAGNKTTEMGVDAHRVTGHVEHNIRVVDSEAIDMNLPQHGFASGCIFRHGVGHLDIQTGILQT